MVDDLEDLEDKVKEDFNKRDCFEIALKLNL